MRWEALFDDMEAQLAAARTAALRADVAELTRAERATVGLVDRLRAAQGSAVALRLAAGEPLRGTLVDVAHEWVLLDLGGAQRALVPVGAVVAVGGLGAHAAPAAGAVERRLGLGHALRALARDRAVVRVGVAGDEVVGRLDGVGADHVDVGGLDGAPGRRPVWTVPFAAITTVRTG